jgi:hypothetical protein
MTKNTKILIFNFLFIVFTFGCQQNSDTLDEEEVQDLGVTDSGTIVVSGDSPADGAAVAVSTNSAGESEVTTVGSNSFSSSNPLPPAWDNTLEDSTSLWGDAVSFYAQASDPNVDQALTYSFDSDDMTCDEGVWTLSIAINNTTGEITGTPSEIDQGSCTISILAESGGEQISQSFILTISSSALPLYWENNLTDFVLSEDIGISATAQAKDDNFGDVISYELDTGNMTCDDGTWNPVLSINSSTGVLSGKPINSDVGTCTVTIIATSALDTIDQTFTITITNLNDLPTWDLSIGNFSSNEDSALSSITASASDVDTVDTVTYSLSNDDMTCDDGSWSPAISIDTNSGSISGTPTNDDVGSCTVNVVASSGSDQISELFTITVDNTADTPTWNPVMGDFTHVEAATLESASRFAVAADVDITANVVYSIQSVDSDDCDYNSDWTVAFTINSATGQLQGTPSNSNIGTCNIRIAATSESETITDDIVVTVSTASAPPTWDTTPSDQSSNEDASFSYTISATDPNADPVTYSIVSGASTTCDDSSTWSTPLDIGSVSGSLSGVPVNDDVGDCDILVRASAGGDNISQIITLTVGNTADAPTWQTEISSFSQEVGSVVSGKTAIAVDVDAADTPSYSLSLSNMTCDDGAWSPQISVHESTGVLSGMPRTDDMGSCTVRIEADSGVNTLISDFTVTVTATSNAPTTVNFVAPSAVVAGECSSVELQSIDTGAYPANVGSDETITLSVNNGTGAFYSENTCTTTATTAVISTGNYTEVVYFESVTAPQSLTLIGTSPSYANASHSINVGSTASTLLIDASPEIVTDDCAKITVFRIDTYGNKISESGSVTVDLTENNNAVFYSDLACGSSVTQIVIPSSEDNAIAYLKDSSVETVVLTATDNASSLTSDNASVDMVTSLSWWNVSWLKRVRISIDNLDQATTFTNIPVLIKLDDTKIDYSDFKAAGADIAFVASDDSTSLKFDIDVWDTGGDSFVWVKVDSIAASSSDNYIYLYYDNSAATTTEDPVNVWTDYFGVWHLEEDPTAGSPQYEDGTGSNDGSASNSPTQTTGVTGNAIDVGGSDDTMDTGTDLSAVIGATSTLSIWLKTSQTGNINMWASPGIAGIEQAGGGNDIFFGWIDNNGYIGVTAGNGSAAKSNFVVHDNVWRHITITRDHVTGTVQFFVNGVKNNTGSSETGAKTLSFTKFGIIDDTGGTPEDLNGAMDEIHLFSGVQTDARIKADFKFQLDSYFSYSPGESQ